MAVNHSTGIAILAISLLISGISCASEPTESNIVKAATSNYKSALADYEKQLRYCKDKADKNKLNRDIFKDIKLTQLQMQTAIGRFYFIALDKCESEKFGAYLIQRGIYRETVKKFEAKFDSDNPIYYDDLEIFGTRYYHIRFDLKYTNFPKSEREKLENIPELKNVFHLMSAIGN
ncbi:MAG: hypothetical protein ACC657_01550 [Thiohalomonadales bacterium]